MQTIPYLTDESLLKFIAVLDKTAIAKDSIALLLFLAKASQNRQARKSFFLTCCFLSVHNHANEYFIWSEMYWFWKQSIFFLAKKPLQMFKYFEYHLNNEDGLCFGIDSFHQKKYDSDLMLPYNRFYLRIDIFILFLFWINLEFTRMQKYNEYIKNHFFINKADYLPTRFRLKQFIYRRPWTRLETLRFRFWTQFIDLRYRLVAVKFIDRKLKTHKFTLEDALYCLPSLLNNPLYKSIKVLTNLYFIDLVSQNNTYFDLAFLSKINSMANHSLAIYPDRFMTINRFDWDNYLETSNLFAFTNIEFSRFREVWTGIFLDKLACSTANTDLVYNNRMVEELVNFYDFQTEEGFDENHNFLYHVFDVIINDYFDQEIFDLLFVNTFQGRKQWAQVASHYTLHYQPIDSRDFRGWMTIFHQYFHKQLLFGQYYKVNTFFTRFICWSDYFYWRIWNAESEYWFLDGRLEFSYLLRKLQLDNMISNHILNIWSLCDMFLKKYGFFLRDKEPRLWNLNSRKVFSKAYHRENPHDLKITNWIHFSIIQAFYNCLFSASYKLQFIAHFSSFSGQEKDLLKKYNKYQNNTLRRFVENYHCLRTARWIYKRQQTEYRRYLNKNCLISIKTNEYHITWFSFFHRMRRAGVPKQDMAFYIKERVIEGIDEIPLPPFEDYINSLVQKYKVRKFRFLPKRFWIIINE